MQALTGKQAVQSGKINTGTRVQPAFVTPKKQMHVCLQAKLHKEQPRQQQQNKIVTKRIQNSLKVRAAAEQDKFVTPQEFERQKAREQKQARAENKIILGEFFATALLNYMASSSAYAAGVYIQDTLIRTLCCAFGTSLLFMVIFYTFQPICGALMNPTVTLSLWIGQQLKPRLAIILVATQALGAWFGNLIYLNQVPMDRRLPQFLGASIIGNSPHQLTAAFIGEFMGSFILVMAVYGHIIDKRGVPIKVAAATIGLTLAILTFMLAPISGACFNPTRVLGLGIISNYFDNIWIYMAAPVLGGGLAAFTHRTYFQEDDQDEDDEE